MHRGRLAIAAAAVAGVTAILLTVGSAADPRPQLPTRAQVCAGTRDAVDELTRQYPDAPREQLEAMAKEVCSRGPVYAPVSAPEPIKPSPGCHLLTPADRRRPVRRRTATQPRPGIPFFATRSGALPPSGAPVVGGVQLPRGSRCGPFWSTDAGVADAWGLARRLASAFPSTGLWPVVWTGSPEEPDSYVNRLGDPAHADSLDAESLMRQAWKETSFARTRPFPGMAAGAADANRVAVDPFGSYAQASVGRPVPPGGWIVMLVPVNRPADVISVLGPGVTEYFEDDELTAVLRSWEERFGAVVSALSPGGIDLAVGAPPRDGEQARHLAVEHALLAPDDEAAVRHEEYAQWLRSNEAVEGWPSAHYWVLVWPD